MWATLFAAGLLAGSKPKPPTPRVVFADARTGVSQLYSLQRSGRGLEPLFVLDVVRYGLQLVGVAANDSVWAVDRVLLLWVSFHVIFNLFPCEIFRVQITSGRHGLRAQERFVLVDQIVAAAIDHEEPLQLRIFSNDVSQLTQLAGSAEAQLAALPELTDVTNSLAVGPEATVTPIATRLQDLGLTAQLSARVVVVTTFTVWRHESGNWLLALEALMDQPAGLALPADAFFALLDIVFPCLHAALAHVRTV